MADSEHCNLVSLERKATWQFPTAQNVLTGWGPAAVAVLCDACVETDRPISRVIEVAGDEIVYHAAGDLETLPPEPTYVVSGDPPRIQCLRCGLTSFHPQDIRMRFCGHCHQFHKR